MNTLTNYIVPNWISIAFLAVIFIPSIMLAFWLNKDYKIETQFFIQS